MIKRTSILAAVIFVCIAGDSSAQTYNGIFYEYYFGRQPSARAEAMGRSICAESTEHVFLRGLKKQIKWMIKVKY